jgi:hypothetical protein
MRVIWPTPTTKKTAALARASRVNRRRRLNG